MTESPPIEPGTFVYVKFNDPGDRWHEFMIGKFVKPGIYVVASPDGEFVQELQVSDDVYGLMVGTKRWVLPAGLGGHVGVPVYRFPSTPSAADFQAFSDRCGKLVTEWLNEPENADVQLPLAAPAGSNVPAEAFGIGGMPFDNSEWVSIVGDDAEPGVIYSEQLIKDAGPVVGLSNWVLVTEAGKITVLRKFETGKGDEFIQATPPSTLRRTGIRLHGVRTTPVYCQWCATEPASAT